MALVLLRYLAARNLVDPRGAVVNLQPSFDRARLARGTLDLLGLWDCAVGIGTDGGPGGRSYKNTFVETAGSYIPSQYCERSFELESGRQLMYRLFSQAAPTSLTLVLISSLKDVALFLRDNEELFCTKVNEVCIMGGVEPIVDGEFILPDTVRKKVPEKCRVHPFGTTSNSCSSRHAHIAYHTCNT